MSSPAFQGGANASNNMGGLSRNGLVIGKEIGTAAASVQSAAQVLESHYGVLLKAAIKLGSSSRASDVAPAALKEFAGIGPRSLRQCLEQADLLQKKLIGIDIKAQDLDRTLAATAKAADDLGIDFLRQARDRLKDFDGGKGLLQLPAIQKRLQSELRAREAAVEIGKREAVKLHGCCKATRQRADDILGRLRALRELKTVDDRTLQSLRTLSPRDVDGLNVDRIAASATDLLKALAPLAADFPYDLLRRKVLQGTPLA